MFRKTETPTEDTPEIGTVDDRTGNVRWGLIAMLLGAPLPVVLLAFLFMNARGCQ